MRVAVLAVTLLLTIAPLSAQRGGGGGGGGGEGGGGGGAAPLTPFELLVDELDLDKKTQVPAVAALLEGVEKEAAALFQELVPRRQDLLNAATNGSTDPAPGAAYTAAATKLIALEAKTFSEIFAQLTPKQKQRAVKGFDRLEALFKEALSTSGGARGSGRGGAGRGAPPQGGGR